MNQLSNLFGVHEKALMLRGERVSVLATNIANADTPNYKSRDFDFAATMAGAERGTLPLATTRAMHISTANDAASMTDLKYRVPFQPALDGNTVEVGVEQSKFAENAVHYQASLGFINSQISQLNLAISGQ